MNKIMLSIIIPYYEETPRDVFPVLASLNGQIGVNFEEIECILVNDGSHNVFPPDFLRLFENLSLRVIYAEENRGPGVARQMGIDDARGEYVMFCDADDTLQNVHVLWSFMQIMESDRPDVLHSQWYEEHLDAGTGKFRYFLRDSNGFTFLHGKVFRTAFLRDKKIRFHEKLRIHEDAYFMNLVKAESENTQMLNIVSYIWKYSEKSLTRKDHYAYSAKAISEHMKSLLCVLAELEKRHSKEMGAVTASIVIFYYFALHQKQWKLPENQALLMSNERMLQNEVKKYIHYYSETPYEFIAPVFAGQRAVFFESENGIEMEAETEIETLNEWLCRLGLQ